MHNDVCTKVKSYILLIIFLNFLLCSEELYAVQCEATGRRDHGRIDWFSIRHAESIRPNRFELIRPSNRFQSIRPSIIPSSGAYRFAYNTTDIMNINIHDV